MSSSLTCRFNKWDIRMADLFDLSHIFFIIASFTVMRFTSGFLTGCSLVDRPILLIAMTTKAVNTNIGKYLFGVFWSDRGTSFWFNSSDTFKIRIFRFIKGTSGSCTTYIVGNETTGRTILIRAGYLTGCMTVYDGALFTCSNKTTRFWVFCC